MPLLERDFAERYRAAQKRERAPVALVEATHVLVEHAQGDRSARTSTISKGAEGTALLTPYQLERPARTQQPKPYEPQRHPSRRPRWLMPVAACLMALLVLFSAGSTFLSAGSPLNAVQARAYAKTPNLLTADLDTGIIPFALDTQLGSRNGWGWWAGGYCTPMQFTVGGEGIERIQATLSRGELYRATTETLIAATDPERSAKLDEALDWSAEKRGTGAYYRDYDCVFVTPYAETIKVDDPVQVHAIKLLGPTIDIPYEGEPLTLGFWFSNDDVSALANGSPNLFELDGEELVLTTQFTDGTFRTQTFTLHDGWFSWALPLDAIPDNLDSVVAEGPFDILPSDFENSLVDDQHPVEFAIKTLYGKVSAITSEPHPFSLDGANARMNEPLEPYVTTLEESLGPVKKLITVEGVPSESNVRRPNESFPNGQWSYERNGWADLRWSDLSAFVSSTLPDDMPLSDCAVARSFRGDIAYMNRCRLATGNWSVSETGRVNDDNSFVVMDATVTNAESETVMFSARDLRGALCAVDEQAGTTTFAAAGIFGAKDDQGRIWGDGLEGSFTLGPGESTRLRVVLIADNIVAQADEVLFTASHPLSFERPLASEDVRTAEFISLGKLERR